jgi:hypothetical protein
MQLELQVKTNDKGDPCWDNSCPARFKVTDGDGYVIVGRQLDGAELAQAGDLAPGECAVWVPDAIIERR